MTYLSSQPDVSLSAGFISSKFRPPTYNIDLISRPQLLEKLDDSADKSCIIIHAPAGYGKSVLLTQWLQQLDTRGTRTAWLGLDADDKETLQFLSYIYSAITVALRKQSAKSKKNEHHADFNIVSSKAAFVVVLNLLEEIQEPVFIFLDDYHSVQTASTDEILDSLIRKLPSNAHLVISSRVRPGLSLTQLRAQGKLLEVTAQDLRFSQLEAEKIFGDVLSSEKIVTINDRVEGWVIALQLTRLWLQSQSVLDDKLQNYADISGNITDYLNNEVLKNLSQADRQVLIETSILDQINGDIANTICKRNDCWEVINSFSNLNALIIPLNKEGQWFRYHYLFAEFLRNQLTMSGSERVRQIHLAASDWYERNGYPDQAVKHACRANNEARAVSLIEELGAVRIGLTVGLPLLSKLLSYLSIEAIYRSPRLHLAKAWLLAKEGELKLARKCYNEVKFDVLPNDDATEPNNELLHQEGLFVDMMLFDIYEDKGYSEQDITNIENLTHSVSQVDHWLQGWLNNILCIMYLRRGDLSSAGVSNYIAMSHYKQADSAYGQIYMYLHLAMIKTLAGSLNEAAEAIEIANEWSHRQFISDIGLISLIQTVRAEILYERNEINGADKLIFSALRNIEHSEGWVEVYGRAYVVATGISYATDGIEPAVKLLDQALFTANGRNLPRLHWLAICRKIELLTRNRRLAEAQSLADEHLSSLDDTNYSFLTWREIENAIVVTARLAVYQDNAEKVLGHLNKLQKEAQDHGRGRSLMRVSIMQMLAFDQLQDRDHAIAALRQALSIAVPEGFLRIFIDEGERMAGFLRSAVRHIGAAKMSPEIVRFIAEVLTALKHPMGKIETDTDPNILSDRELQVLHELALGHVNKIIARNLDLTVATVKFHLSNIYQKLGVNSRNVAIAVARKQNLIS